jgi:hypothetical protein
MRRWLLFTLIAVLCLRAWAGEVMAGQMLAQQLHAATAAAQQAEPMQHGPDCMAAMAEADQATDDGVACGSCLHCQDCSLTALPVLAPALQAALPHAPRAHVHVAFASAEPAQRLKPPIL